MRAALLAVMLLAEAATAQVSASDAVVRERLAARRAAVEATYAESERACAKRFLVTDCLDAARTRKREALTELDLSEATLDDAERHRRASARLQRIDEKRARREADERQRAATPLLPPEAASAAVRSPGRPIVAPRAPVSVEPAGSAAQAAEDAQRRRDEQRARAAYDARQRDAAQRREVLERRHQQGKPKAAPLPPIPPGSAP